MDLLTQTNNEKAIINTPSESGTIGSIDIPSPGIFSDAAPVEERDACYNDREKREGEICGNLF